MNIKKSLNHSRLLDAHERHTLKDVVFNVRDIRFGPAGLGSIINSVQRLNDYNKAGLRACEIAFVHGPYIKKDEDARIIGNAARELDIKLSIHAPYYVNLGSIEKEKREASVKRILDCCRIGELLGAATVVFHPGYYGENKEESYGNIFVCVKEMLETIKKNSWKIKIAPETMGKVNVFGSVEEINRLVRETGCAFCIDFAHILARDKEVDYSKVERLFPGKEWHVHFSGIIYGEKGEKSHKTTEKGEWKDLLKNMPKNKEIVVINESPTCVEDSIEGLKIFKEI
jgi:deoxyribonuclease-4